MLGEYESGLAFHPNSVVEEDIKTRTVFAF